MTYCDICKYHEYMIYDSNQCDIEEVRTTLYDSPTSPVFHIFQVRPLGPRFSRKNSMSCQSLQIFPGSLQLQEETYELPPNLQQQKRAIHFITFSHQEGAYSKSGALTHTSTAA